VYANWKISAGKSTKLADVERGKTVKRKLIEPRTSPLPARPISNDRGLLPEDQFHRLVLLERKRARRSGKPFLLVHLDITRYLSVPGDGKARQRILSALTSATRDTDIVGWSKNEMVIGIMFIEVGAELDSPVMATMLVRVSDVLRNILALEQFRSIDISFQRFPEAVDELSMPQLIPQLFGLAGND
jgi:hypothetical protein